MTQEEKELLLKDLCARLPYRVEINHQGYIQELTVIVLEDIIYSGHEVKSYLRSMSSMTDEEQFQLGRLMGATSYNLLKGEYSSLKDLLEYSYKNHIDLFGLIPKGLALEAPEGMYKQ